MQNIQKSILNMVMQKWLNSDYLIIDTETTGLDNNAEVIEIAIINMHGDVLLNSLVKPTCSIPAVVTKINNITDEMVADAPLWRDIFPVILNIIDGKKWLAWNSKFDARLIIQTGVITGYFEDLPASKILDIAAKLMIRRLTQKRFMTSGTVSLTVSGITSNGRAWPPQRNVTMCQLTARTGVGRLHDGSWRFKCCMP
ncbi:3'-5' exonuclease (plasmid) [Salmonella enterica]|nr:3'-5' exonuclease [Salmonella enterica]